MTVVARRVRHSMGRASRPCALACVACAIAGIALPARAVTYYVRVDGGSAEQCDGRSDIAYVAGGDAHCAWRHPFVALPPSGPARIAGGDTLLVGAGSYMIGYGAADATGCYAAGAFDCTMQPVPSGPSPDQPTRILGIGHDKGCPAPPELWGTERAYEVLDLQGSSNVEVGCFEITDHSSCIEFHCAGGQCDGGGGQIDACRRDTPPFGPWASVGIRASASSNVSLHDLDVHGLAHTGLGGGGLRDWTLRNVRLVANGWGGWNGDIGAASSNSGSIALRGVEIGWNGCGERYPGGEIFGCWAQQEGGYGDGLGTAATGGDWLIEDSFVHHNTSDGIDLLYADGSGSVTVRRTRVEGNAGNQIKTRGDATIENSVVDGNCAYFDGRYNMSDGDQCRALGNTLSLALGGGDAVTVRYNTIVGEGDCLILAGGGDAGSRLDIQNNALIGKPDWRATRQGNPEQTCLQYSDDGTATVAFLKNLVWQVKHDDCPPGSVCGAPPGIASDALDGFDPVPLAGSPLVDAADAGVTVAEDYLRTPRPQGTGYDIGAIERRADLVFADGFEPQGPARRAPVRGAPGSRVALQRAMDASPAALEFGKQRRPEAHGIAFASVVAGKPTLLQNAAKRGSSL